MTDIPLAIPALCGGERKFLLEALDNSFIAVGPHIGIFESEMIQFIGASHAIAVNSGTAALQLMIEASNVGEGDIILTPALTFAATVNAIIRAKCHPLFLDIDPSDLCLDFKKLRRFLSEECIGAGGKIVHRESNRRIGGIMIVHMYGNACDASSIQSIVQEFDIEIFEDGAEALGAKIGDTRLGARSRYFALSFNGNKVITSGGGGMVLTYDAQLAKNIRQLASQGKSESDPEQIDFIGHNFRMPNLNAAFACGQMVHLEDYVKKKQEIARIYGDRLGQIRGLSMVCSKSGTTGSCWMSVLRIDVHKCGHNAASLGKSLEDRGIQTRPVWKPLDGMTPYRRYLRDDLIESHRVYETDICLPCSVNLTIEDIERVCGVIEETISLN